MANQWKWNGDTSVGGTLAPHGVQDNNSNAGAAGALLSAGPGAGLTWVARQTQRISFNPSETNSNNEYMNIPVTFAQSFADLNYSIVFTLELDTASTPVWQANHSYSTNQIIIDSNGMPEQVTTPGESGATVPVWTTVSEQTTSDNGVVWTLFSIADGIFVGTVKFKEVSGFTVELGVAEGVFGIPMVLSVVALHD